AEGYAMSKRCEFHSGSRSARSTNLRGHAAPRHADQEPAYRRAAARSLRSAHNRDAGALSFLFQAEDGIRGPLVTGVQTCALPISVAAGADQPLVREQFVAAYVHGETGLDGPDLPPPQKEPVAQHAVDFLAEKIRSSDRPVTLIPVGPLTNVALLLALHPDARPERIV